MKYAKRKEVARRMQSCIYCFGWGVLRLACSSEMTTVVMKMRILVRTLLWLYLKWLSTTFAIINNISFIKLLQKNNIASSNRYDHRLLLFWRFFDSFIVFESSDCRSVFIILWISYHYTSTGLFINYEVKGGTIFSCMCWLVFVMTSKTPDAKHL